MKQPCPLGAHPLKPGSPLSQAEGVLKQIAEAHRTSPTQIALTWLLHRAPNMLLIPGTTTISHLEENLQAMALKLSADEQAQLNVLRG